MTNKQSLLVNRIKNLAIEMYKVKYNLVPGYITEMFTPEMNPYNLRDNCKYILPWYNYKTFGYRCFNFMGAKIWNNLDTSVKNAPTVSMFKIKLNQWCNEYLRVDDYI